MIRKNVKKAISFALAGVMVLSLAACGKQGSGGGLFGGGSNNKKQTDPMLAKVNVFRGTEVNLVDKENENIYAIGNVGGKLAAVTAYYDYANNKQGAYIKYLSENGSVTGTYEITAPDVSMYRPDNYEELINNSQNSGVDNGPNEPVILDDMPVVDDDYYYDDYDRPSYDESFYYNNFMISDDGIIGVCEYYNYYEDTENGYMNNDVVMITKWDSTGNAVWTANMSDSLNMEYAYIGSACITNSGEIFAMVSGDGSTKMVFLNSDGSMKSSKSVDDLVNVNDVSTVFQLKSGKYVAFYYDQNYNNCASYFDPEKFSFEDKVEIPEQLKATGYNALIPGDTTEFIVSTSEGVYGFNLGDVELTKIMDYVNSDFDGYAINNLYFLNSNSFVGIYESADDYTTKVAIFNYVDPSTIPDKEIVTVASYYLDSKIKSHIATFNKTNEKYRVMLKDYSKYATEDNYYEGTTKLNNEILAGDVPDIIIMNGYAIDLTPYAKKKMLVDFDELIQKDEELFKNQ